MITLNFLCNMECIGLICVIGCKNGYNSPPLSVCTLLCNMTVADLPTRRWDLFPHILSLGWPWDSLWPIERSGSDNVPVLRLDLNRPFFLLFTLSEPFRVTMWRSLLGEEMHVTLLLSITQGDSKLTSRDVSEVIWEQLVPTKNISWVIGSWQ